MVTAARAREKSVARRIDGLQVVVDDDRAVASAGLILPATLAARLGLENLIDEAVDLGRRPGAARPGRKVMTLVHAILAGADCIDDCRLLRAGQTEAVLGHRLMAPPDARHLPARVHLRPCAPARSRERAGPGARLGGRGRAPSRW